MGINGAQLVYLAETAQAAAVSQSVMDTEREVRQEAMYGQSEAADLDREAVYAAEADAAEAAWWAREEDKFEDDMLDAAGIFDSGELSSYY